MRPLRNDGRTPTDEQKSGLTILMGKLFFEVEREQMIAVPDGSGKYSNLAISTL